MSLSVSCTVNVSVEDISVNSLEKAALTGAREAGRRLLQALFELVERAIPKHRRCACGGRLESRGRVERELMTLVGDILFSRQKLRCLNCGRAILLMKRLVCGRDVWLRWG